MKKLLIRADDLGFSEGVNYGIQKAVKGGLVRSAGVMTNMPAARHGLDLLAALPVCLGQHTNICTGRPITDPALIPSIVNEDGTFKSSKAYRLAKEDFVDLDEVILEIEAQYEAFKALTGREPDYFEGHAVASPNFFKGLEIVAKRHYLPYFPMGMPGQPVTFKNTSVTSYFPSDMKAYEEDPLFGLQETLERLKEDDVMMMVLHPGYIDQDLLSMSSMTLLRPKEAAMISSPAARAMVENSGAKLVTYADLD